MMGVSLRTGSPEFPLILLGKNPALGAGGGEYFWEFFVGVCRPVLQLLTLFQTKKFRFPRPFLDLAF